MLEQEKPDNEKVIGFLHLCLSSRWDTLALNNARALSEQGGLDWDALLQLSDRDHLAPLLYDVVRGKALVPERIEQRLEAAYFRTASRNTLLFNELESVLNSFKITNQPVIILKGAALAEALYENIALRPMTDLDLLVHPGNAQDAMRALRSLGYASLDSDGEIENRLGYQSEIMLVKPGTQATTIDLHWGLLDSPYYHDTLALEWFWETATPIQIGKAAALTLGREAQVLHLCAHIFLEQAEQALWMHDVAELIARGSHDLNWDEILDRAQQHDLILPLQSVLRRVIAQWHVAVPDAALSRLNGLRASAAEIRFERWLGSNGRPMAGLFIAAMTALPDWQSRLRHLWSNLFPSSAYMLQRYQISNRFLVPFYYPYRWMLALKP